MLKLPNDLGKIREIKKASQDTKTRRQTRRMIPVCWAVSAIIKSVSQNRVNEFMSIQSQLPCLHLV